MECGHGHGTAWACGNVREVGERKGARRAERGVTSRVAWAGLKNPHVCGAMSVTYRRSKMISLLKLYADGALTDATDVFRDSDHSENTSRF